MSYNYVINGYDKENDTLVLAIYFQPEHNTFIEYRMGDKIANGNEWTISVPTVHALIRRLLQIDTGVPSRLEYYIGAVQ